MIRGKVARIGVLAGSVALVATGCASGSKAIGVGKTGGSQPATTVSTTLSTTTTVSSPPPGSTTTVPESGEAAQLAAYISVEAARDKAAASQTPMSWNGYLFTQPVNDAGVVVAVAAFSYDPAAKPVQVLAYTQGQWTHAASLPLPWDDSARGAAMNSGWLANYAGLTITDADVTGDGRPDFLIPLGAADNTPGLVLSQDGTSGGTSWRFVPYIQGSATTLSYEFARDARFQGNKLVTTYDNCQPNCAQGTTNPITWTYQRASARFWAASPPG
ncbi:MAG TPA: hypothetical protein VNG12_18595 [Acidimicrobiales bacterium]|nr:hypothetical protein [Acidimicrobiales bacterium]